MNVEYKNTNYFSLKHPYNLGDLITVLPGLQQLYKSTGIKTRIYQQLNLPAVYLDDKDHPVKNESGIMVTMNLQTFKMLQPLVEEQEYIESFRIWQGEEVQFDIADTRDRSQVPSLYGLIHTWPMLAFPQLHCDLSEAWIKANPEKPSYYNLQPRTIIINRTQRHYNPHIHYGFLKEYEKDCGFIGTADEHKAFCEAFDLNIERFMVPDFLSLANTLNACTLFIGNQSFCWHVADAMKIPRLLEVSPDYPNTLPTGAKGYGFLYQNALLYYFKKMV